MILYKFHLYLSETNLKELIMERCGRHYKGLYDQLISHACSLLQGPILLSCQEYKLWVAYLYSFCSSAFQI